MPGKRPAPPWAWRTGAALTALAALQQLALACGLPLPGWQPWPLLLAAAPLLWWGRAGLLSGLAALPGPPPALRARLAAVPPGALVAAVLGLAALLWAALQDHEPWIGHEESVYANKARSWTEGGPPAAGWGEYRPPGLPLLGTLALRLHDDVGALRAVTLLLALAMLATTYLVAARWTTPHRAVLTVLLVLCGLGFLRRLPEFLNDIGSTGLLLVVVFLLTRAQERPGSRALLALPPFVLAAFYLRYGVAGNLAAILLAALLAYGPRAWLAQGRRLAVAGGVVLAGLVPHFVHATQVTGSPLGLVFWATSQAERQFVGDGLLYYLAIFPYRLAGDLGGVLMAAGLVAAYPAVRRLRRKGAGGEPVPGARRRAFLGLTSVLIFVLLGVATDGEPRFVYLPVVLLTFLGVQALAEAAGEQRRRLLAAVGVLALLTAAGTARVVAHGAMPGPTGQARSTVPVARALAHDGDPCLLVTGYEPETGWYSGCDAVTYRQYRAAPPPAAGTRVAFIRYAHGRHQPGDRALAELTRGLEPTVRRFPATGVLGAATVVTVRARG
ncbi:glycosyltransferase [Streptomyces diastaticus]|uniref:glycosyltransferase n=1 Tax=Streptomyces diastaticus TaxID=1956 RepID=UPI0037A8A730